MESASRTLSSGSTKSFRIKSNGSLTIFALFPSDDEVIRRERPSRRMAAPSDETNKVSFAKIVKEPI